MASGGKQTKIEDPAHEDFKAESPEGEPAMKDQQPMFLPTDVTLKVEGKLFYLNKKRLSENSPVLKAMFESDLKRNMRKLFLYLGRNLRTSRCFKFILFSPTYTLN